MFTDMETSESDYDGSRQRLVSDGSRQRLVSDNSRGGSFCSALSRSQVRDIYTVRPLFNKMLIARQGEGFAR